MGCGALGPQLDHRQPAVPEGHPCSGSHPEALGVGAPVGQHRGHGGHVGGRGPSAHGPPGVEQARRSRTPGSGPRSAKTAARPRAGALPRRPPARPSEIIGGAASGVKQRRSRTTGARSSAARTVVVGPMRVWQPAACPRPSSHEPAGPPADGLRPALSPAPPQVLHGLGRYAPWEVGFDFTPPPSVPARMAGPARPSSASARRRPAPPGGTSSCSPTRASPPRDDIHKERHFFDRFGARCHGAVGHRPVPRLVPPRRRDGDRRVDPDYLDLPVGARLLDGRHRTPDSSSCSATRSSGSVPASTTWTGWASPGTAPPWPMPCSVGSTSAPSRSGWTTSTPTSSSSSNMSGAWPTATVSSDVDLPASRACRLTIPRPTNARPARRAAGRRRLDDDVRRYLTALYAPDVTGLAEQHAGLDLALWPNFAYLTGSAPMPPASGTELAHPTAVAGVLPHPAEGAVPQAVGDGRPLGPSAGRLQLAGRVGQLPGVPAGADRAGGSGRTRFRAW